MDVLRQDVACPHHLGMEEGDSEVLKGQPIASGRSSLAKICRSLHCTLSNRELTYAITKYPGPIKCPFRNTFFKSNVYT